MGQSGAEEQQAVSTRYFLTLLESAFRYSHLLAWAILHSIPPAGRLARNSSNSQALRGHLLSLLKPITQRQG